MKEVIIRLLSGVIYISIILFSLFMAREWYIGLLFILAIITLNEFLKLINLRGTIAYIILAVSFYFLAYKLINSVLILILLSATILINLFLIRDIMVLNKISLLKSKRYLYIIFYIISGFVFLALIPFTNKVFEPKIILGIFILAWTNDTFAYLVGKGFGKRKLMENISPKKTIEGFYGGMAGALFASFIFFKFIPISEYNLIFWLFLALLVSVLGTIGDLIQSKFKRLAGVKDSGNIMPGHGGVYDRLDSIIFASPFIYLFIIIINYVS
ncbi:phosphatidate cytidylyltransferase [Flavobacteriaceae bacterium]|jgi:phosphatidate cytidylyltransferase|nr:phosphatidate cytidylyltransferase [Flavobacteriaceae bacterium]MDB9912731.1 phosphatidate cytidylyltransferase [Flavobacteriaceae bacterium]MDB9994041.1 phosphatidate cytidylyltransferase [Flavobacteriaceae bacterium]